MTKDIFHTGNSYPLCLYPTAISVNKTREDSTISRKEIEESKKMKFYEIHKTKKFIGYVQTSNELDFLF